MISILLAAALLSGAQDTPLEVPYVLSEADTVTFPIGDLTGADELAELRDAILSESLPVSVRRASLDRYTELLESGDVRAEAETLARSLKLFVDPLDDPAFEVTAPSPSEITIKGTAEQRQWAWGFLTASRNALEVETLLEFEVKIFSAPKGSREKVLPTGAGLSLSPGEAEKLEKELGGMEGVEIVSAPRVTVHVGAPAEISVIESIPYIREYETTILPDLSTEICDPVIATVQDGLTLRVRGAFVSEETLKVRTEFTASSVRRPLQQIERPVGSLGNVVTLQIPEVKTVQASASFDVQDESVIVLSTVDPGFEGDESRDVLLVIRTLVLETVDPQKEVK